MAYTDERPTVPGYYWVWYFDVGLANVWEGVVRVGPDSDGRLWLHRENESWPVDAFGAQWHGPLTPPR